MTPEQIDSVFTLISKNFRVDKTSVKPESTFQGDLKADSLDVVEFFIDIEDEFKLDIDIEGLQGTVITVQDAIDAIAKLLAAK